MMNHLAALELPPKNLFCYVDVLFFSYSEINAEKNVSVFALSSVAPVSEGYAFA